MENFKELGHAGIILIKKKDIITSLLLKYLNVNYSHIGFYYKKNNLLYIIILNIIEITESITSEHELYQYIKSDNVIIEYKKLNKNGIGDHFNSCIKELLNINKKVSQEDIILDFFSGKINTFKLFNQVMRKIDTSINDDNDNNYLLDSNYFDIVKQLNIPIKDTFRSVDIKTYNYYINTHKSFTNIVSNSPLLENKIIKILNNRNIQNNNDTFLDELTSNYFFSSQQIFQDILNGIRNKKLKNGDFINHLKIMARDFDNLNGKTFKELNDIDNTKEDFIFTPDTKTRITATNNLKNIINNIAMDIKNETVPIINLNKIIFNFNNLMKCIDSNYRSINNIDDDISIYGMITAGENLKDIPMQLKNGDKILIPMSETNYSRFNKDQLEEMLTLLDIYANGNNKFDQIRTNITKEIAHKTNM